LGPHVDGVDPRERERPVAELWDDVGFLDGGWTDAGAGSDELERCVAYALVDDSEPVVIADVACVFEPIDGLSHCLVGRVEVLGDTTDGVTTLDGEESLCRRVVDHLIHLVVTHNSVTVKSFTSVSVGETPTEFDRHVKSPCLRSCRSPGNADRDFGSDVGRHGDLLVEYSTASMRI
jgi:hypothetical protein